MPKPDAPSIHSGLDSPHTRVVGDNKRWHSLTLAARQKASLISAAFCPGYRAGDPLHAIGEVRAETSLNLVHICRCIVTRGDNTP